MKNIVTLAILFISLTSVAQKKLEVSGLRFENIKYPFPVKEIMLEIQGQKLKMAYMDLEPKQPNGKNVLLLHGKNFSSNYWEQTANDLAKEGYRVIMPDQIGFGKSSKPTNIQYSFQLLAQNTKALLDDLKITKISVVGHSMGGMLATRFALMYPELAEKLILENPIGLEDYKAVVPYQSVDEWYQTEIKQDYDKMKAYQLQFYYSNQWKPEYDAWLDPVAGWTINKDYSVIAMNSALLYDMIYTQPVFYEFRFVKTPSLLIIGQLDRTAIGRAKAPRDVQDKIGNYPVLGRLTSKKLHAQLVEIPNAGHLPHIQTYGEFIKPLLEFLKQ